MAASLAAVGILFFETFAEMVAAWDRASAYKHCYLIAPISIYLIWDQKDRLAGLMPRAGFWGLPVILIFGLAWLVADIANIEEARQFAVVGILQGVFLTILGWPMYRTLSFPLLFLFLAVPTGGYLLPWMQAVATDITVFGLRSIGIPLFVEGIIITVPTGVYRVAPGCAGLNFLLSGVAFALLYGYLMYKGWVKPVLALAAMVGVVFIANGLRIIGIITIAHYMGEQIDIVDDHYFYGWGFFAIVLLVMMWFGLRYRDDDPLEQPSETVKSEPGGLAFIKPFRVIVSGLAAVAVAAVAPAYAAYTGEKQQAEYTIVIPMPDEFGNWRLQEQPTEAESDWQPALDETDGFAGWTYSDGTHEVTVYVGYYWRQDKRREVVGVRNQMADEQKWSRLSTSRRTISLAGQTANILSQRLSSRQYRRLVWYWYWVGGEMVTSTMNAKINQVLATLTNSERRAAIITVSVDENGEPDQAATVLEQFIAANPPFSAALQGASVDQGLSSDDQGS